MAKDKSATLQVATFADHHVITQPNPLRKVLRRVAEQDLDDPVARAEKALAGLSGEFKNWMAIEADRLVRRPRRHSRGTASPTTTRDELFRAAHDIKGDAATFGFPVRRRRRRKPVPDHRARARSRPGAVRPDRASHQRDPGDRARAHQARHRRHGERTEQATARRRGRISHRRSIATGPSISKPSSPRASCRRSEAIAHRHSGDTPSWRATRNAAQLLRARCPTCNQRI